MIRILETKRLYLREFDAIDAEKICELNADPEVLLFSGDLPFASVEQAKEFLENYAEYKNNGYGRWAVILKSSDEFIGWCGLKYNEEKCVDIGFRFFRTTWNKGYATEAARTTLDYGFKILKLEEIIGRASVDNKASIRVLEKLDMAFWKLSSYEGITNAAYY
jgi:ribosomal-protein-alanine N-acetyltransferase